MIKFTKQITKAVAYAFMLGIMLFGMTGVAVADPMGTVAGTKANAGQGLTFNGINQYIELDAPFNRPAETIEIRAKVTGMDKRQLFFGNYTGSSSSYQVELTADNLLRYYESGTLRSTLDIRTTNKFTFGEWVLITYVRDKVNGNVSLYLDGEFVQSWNVDFSVDNYDGVASHLIGADQRRSMILDGAISEIRMWSEVRTPEQIKANAAAELTGTEAGLKHLWLLSEDLIESGILPDSVAGGIDGVLKNFKPVVIDPNKDPLLLDMPFGLVTVSGNTVHDQSAYENNGALRGNAKLVQENFFDGTVLDVDGNASYIHIPYNTDFILADPTKLGLEAVVLFRSNNDGRGQMDIIGRTDSSEYSFCSIGNQVYLRVYIGSGYTDIRFPYEINKAYYLAGTYDGQQLKFYVNGELVGSANRTEPIKLNPAVACCIGADAQGLNDARYFFDGFIDSVRIQNRTLTEQEIQATYAELSQRVDFNATYRQPGKVSMSMDAPETLLKRGDTVDVDVVISNDTENAFQGSLNITAPYFAIPLSGSAHADVSLPAGESLTLNYSYIVIEGGREALRASLLKDGSPLASAVAGISVSGPGFYAGDNHSHTIHSDGSGTIASNVTHAYEVKMLSWLFSTDHNTVSQKNDTVEQTAKYNGKFLNLSSPEFTTSYGHALTLSLSDRVAELTVNPNAMVGNMRGNTAKWQEVVDTINGMEGVFYIAHPYEADSYDYTVGTLSGLRRFAGTEVWNGLNRTAADARSQQQFDAWDMMNSQGTGHYAGITVSDAHSSIKVGDPRIKAFLSSLDPENIMDVLRKGNYIGTNGPELRFNINGVGISETLKITGDIEYVDFNIYACDPVADFNRLNIIRNKISGAYELNRDIVYTYEFPVKKGTLGATISLPVVPGEFYRVEIFSDKCVTGDLNGSGTLLGTAGAGTGYAYTNNIWIEKAEESNATNLSHVQYTGSDMELKTLPTGTMYLSGSKGAVLELDKLTAVVAEGASYEKSYDALSQILSLTVTAEDGTVAVSEIFVLNATLPVTAEGITVNFPGLKDVTVQYYTNISQWVTVGKFDDTCNFTIPESHKATWGKTTVRIVKDGMYHTFTLDAADKALVLDAPLSAITVIGIASACNLAIVQNDWVYRYAPATVGGENEFLVFGNGKAYEIRLQKPGASIISIKGIEAGQTVDLSEHFYGDIAVYDAAHAAFCSYYDTATWTFIKELFLDNIYRSILEAEQIMNKAGQEHADLLTKHGKLAAGRFDASDSVEAIAEGTRILNQGIADMMSVLR